MFLINIITLYAGRFSNALAALFLLPIYSSALGNQDFGILTVILSLQAFAVMLDFGLGTFLTTEIAGGRTVSSSLIKQFYNSEYALIFIYGFLSICILVYKFLGGFSNLKFDLILLSLVMIIITLFQSIYQVVLVANKSYISSSLIQLFGVFFKALSTLIVIFWVSKTLTAFLIAQILASLPQLIYSRHFSKKPLTYVGDSSSTGKYSPKEILKLLKNCRSLGLFTLAGAAVLNLDKPVIALFMGAETVAPYYLAIMLCMTPMTLLSGAINQYFQPIVLSRIASHHDSIKNSIAFIKILFLLNFLPCIAIWLLRMPIIDFWLRDGTTNALISHYVGIMLPFFAFGSLGFVPYTLLLSAKDFKYQAILSTVMTALTIMATAYFALHKNIEAICYVYAGYHSVSALLMWLRAICLTSVKGSALKTLLFTIKSLIILTIALSIIALSLNKPNFKIMLGM